MLFLYRILNHDSVFYQKNHLRLRASASAYGLFQAGGDAALE